MLLLVGSQGSFQKRLGSITREGKTSLPVDGANGASAVVGLPPGFAGTPGGTSPGVMPVGSPGCCAPSGPPDGVIPGGIS